MASLTHRFLFGAVACALLPGAAVAQPEAYCVQAHRFMAESMAMAAVTTPDTIDDWRTDRTLAGCRVTAAGLTEGTARDAAAGFFEALRAAGWSRTPDPRDAPNEASLRFRHDGADCLFSFYTGGLLGTEAEAIVDDARVPGPGTLRYNFAAQCLPALPAAPPSRQDPPWA